VARNENSRAANCTRLPETAPLRWLAMELASGIMGGAMIELGHEVRQAHSARACESPNGRRNKNDRGTRAGDLRGDLGRMATVRAGAFRSTTRPSLMAPSRAREWLPGPNARRLAMLSRGHLADIGLIRAAGAAQHAYGLKRMAPRGFKRNGAIVAPIACAAHFVACRAKSKRGRRAMER